jgi:hypothetical protein
MLHIEKTKGPLLQALKILNSLAITTIKEFKAHDYFDTVLQLCIETNQISALSIGVTYGAFVCKPLFKDEIFEEELHKHLFVDADIRDFFSEFKQKDIIHFPVGKHWEKRDYEELAAIELLDDIEEMMTKSFLVAKRIVGRFDHDIGVVCGPISSGLKSIPENFRIFNRTIFKLSQVMEVWSQMPFEAIFKKAHDSLVDQQSPFLIDGSSSAFFIDRFYRPLFLLNKPWTPHFIFGYEYSNGAMEEKEIFTSLKKKMVFLPEGYEVNPF